MFSRELLSRAELINSVVVLVAVLVGSSCLFVYLGLINPQNLPLGFTSPALAERQDINPNIVAHIAITIGRSEICLFFAIIAYFLALMFGQGKIPGLAKAIAVIYQAVPPLVSAPLILLYFGVTEPILIASCSVFTFAGLVVSSPSDSLRNSQRAAFSRLVGHSRVYRLFYLYIPETLYDVRPALSLLWLVLVGIVVVLEYLGSAAGLGRAISVMISYAEVGMVSLSTLILGCLVGLISFAIMGQRVMR